MDTDIISNIYIYMYILFFPGADCHLRKASAELYNTVAPTQTLGSRRGLKGSALTRFFNTLAVWIFAFTYDGHRRLPATNQLHEAIVSRRGWVNFGRELHGVVLVDELSVS